MKRSPRHLTAAGPASLLVLLAMVLAAAPAVAQERGFRAHRYDGTAAGSWQLLVERPWYSRLRFFAAGVTVDYSHRVLQPAVATGRGELVPIVEHALLGHVELAGSVFDRFLLTATLPVTFYEAGALEPVSQAGPLVGAGVGDPRVGLTARLFGQADRDPFSLHLGADLWIPVGAFATHQSDRTVRLQPHLQAAGAFGPGRWAVDLGFLYRPYASLGPPALGMTAASELKLGVALGLSLLGERLHVGPEAQLWMQVDGAHAFSARGMGLELLGGASLLVGEQVLIGVAAGGGLFEGAGAPDARAILRVAWAPRRDSDGDGILNLDDGCPDLSGARPRGCPEPPADDADLDGVRDAADRCPFEAETPNGIRDGDGCPELELPRGAPLARVLAPEANLTSPRVPPATADAGVARGPGLEGLPTRPPAASAGGPPDAGAGLSRPPTADLRPPPDVDGDGAPDEADRCPVTPEDADGFEDDDGCPEADNDGDGVADPADRCPLEAETVNGEADGDGCPDVAPDEDQDGVPDALDRCPLEPETLDGVRDGDGCPELAHPAQASLSRLLAPTAPPRAAPGAPAGPLSLDADRDGVPDEADRCPVTPEDADGFEDEDGCPEPDDDGDGVLDARDRCADAAETPNGWKDDDGCPDERSDADGDGVEFEADRCPLEPGPAPGGCPRAARPALLLPGFFGVPDAPARAEGQPPPAADLDQDKVPDEADACPVTPEDADGFEDDDGCPEPDNDKDGVADRADRCPFEAEVINGVKDDDGCPDRGAGAVAVKGNAVVIDGAVPFKTGSAYLLPAATPLLKQVAATLKAAASLSVEVQGHTDDTGSAAANIALSKKRAEAIRAFLVKAGVSPQRLRAVGYGPTRPRASNLSPAGREQNRRVEFLILGEAK